jgi:hypothetical protein
MKPVSPELLAQNKLMESKLSAVATQYWSMNDIRWMFAYAHYRITQQINVAAQKYVFRDPDHLIRFNLHFASAFLAAVSGMTSAPWKKAFASCAVAEASYDGRRGPAPTGPRRAAQDPNALAACAAAMASAHINTDIVNALKAVGCINKEDYGNIMLFVARAAREAIIKVNGNVQGEILNALKELFLPLDRVWRNAVYEDVCGKPVPDIEDNFQLVTDGNYSRMCYIHPGQ